MIGKFEKYQGLVVSHTHWDRAWYWPFEWFRIRLVQTIDQIIEILDTIPGYKAFVLDGQTVVLEDYLEVKPEKRADLERLVKSKKLFIGPWYILPDEFLVSGESLIRNLMLGDRICREFGGMMKEGYVPDPFGHIAQMPQILRGFDIRSFIFSRGMGSEIEQTGSEFQWEAPDGSQILALNQRDNYGNLASWGFPFEFGDYRNRKPEKEQALKDVLASIEKIAGDSTTPNLLFNNGVDHLPPQPEVPELIEYVNQHSDNIQLTHGTFSDYVDAVIAANPSLKTIRGELIDNYHRPILLSVYSARMYLKQANFHCQQLLEKFAEPLSVLAKLAAGSDFTPFLQQAWRTLLKNHPHDDICGCSTDEVHRENMTFYQRVRQIGDYISERAILDIAEKNPDNNETRKLFVFNPLNWQRSDVFSAKIRIPVTDEQQQFHLSIALKDTQGKLHPCQIISKKPQFRMELFKDVNYHEYDVRVAADALPANGFAIFEIVPDAHATVDTDLRAGDRWLENAFYRIDVNPNGSFNIVDKQFGVNYPNCHIFEDTEDTGDEYTYSWAENSRTITTENFQPEIRLKASGAFSATIEISGDFLLPAKLSNDRKIRSSEMVQCKLRTEITLLANTRRIECRTEFDNAVEDHRLRVLFPSGSTAKTCFADGHFAVIERPCYFPGMPTAATRSEYYATRHQNTFVSVADEQSGLILANRGLPEYEIIEQNGKATIALTLLRCVGWLSRNDFITRVIQAGPKIATPEAQCPGSHVFEYALIPHQKSWRTNAVFHQAHNFATPIFAQSFSGNFPEEWQSISLIHFDHLDICISAMKIADDGNGIIVRIYNPGDTQISATATAFAPIRKVQLTNLNEETGELVSPDNETTFTVNLGKYEIRTYKIEF
ncbi:MAG: glycoside hydrolase family 38 C-terminal domain-containing protein [Calditrichia bacterium]